MKTLDCRHTYHNKARNKWAVRFSVNGKEKTIGSIYESQSDAIDARNKAYVEYGIVSKSSAYIKKLIKCAEPSCQTHTLAGYCSKHSVTKKKIEGYNGSKKICWFIKRCTKCSKDKPLENYFKSKRRYDGRNTVCKECSGYTMGWKERKDIKLKEAEGNCIKTCTSCGEDKKAISFKLEVGVGRTGRRSRCKVCDNAAERFNVASLSEDQREERRARARAYRYANPSGYRARKEKRYRRMKETSDGSITRSSIKLLLSTAKECSYCNKPLRTEASKTIDHVVPLDKLGQHVLSNLTVACKQCNLSKGAKLLHEWEPIQLYG